MSWLPPPPTPAEELILTTGYVLRALANHLEIMTDESAEALAVAERYQRAAKDRAHATDQALERTT